MHHHAIGGRAALIRLVLAQLAADLVGLDRHFLDIVAVDLVEKPRIVVHRGLGLGHEQVEDDRETADQEQPQPGGGRRPTGTV